MPHQPKAEVMALAQAQFTALAQYASSLSDANANQAPAAGKWSPVQHLQHLNRSMQLTNLVLGLPHFIIRWQWGRPNRASRTYDALVARYLEKLAAGPVFAPRFAPKPGPASMAAELQHWQRHTQRFARIIDKRWTDAQLEQYLIGHPLLGRITIREMAYFTAYHAAHHLKGMQGQPVH